MKNYPTRTLILIPTPIAMSKVQMFFLHVWISIDINESWCRHCYCEGIRYFCCYFHSYKQRLIYTQIQITQHSARGNGRWTSTCTTRVGSGHSAVPPWTGTRRWRQQHVTVRRQCVRISNRDTRNKSEGQWKYRESSFVRLPCPFWSQWEDSDSDSDSCSMQKFPIGSDSDSDPLIEM